MRYLHAVLDTSEHRKLSSGRVKREHHEMRPCVSEFLQYSCRDFSRQNARSNERHMIGLEIKPPA
eukprot:IDg19589t1